MFEVGPVKEEQIQEAIAAICNTKVETTELVVNKAVEFQKLLDELKKAGRKDSKPSDALSLNKGKLA